MAEQSTRNVAEPPSSPAAAPAPVAKAEPAETPTSPAPEPAPAVVASPGPTARLRSPNLSSAKLFINRELSWLRFNERVLREALDSTNPLLERVKFLSILHSNLDEFFMVRVSGLRRQMEAGVLEAPPDGMTPSEQLTAILDEVAPTLEASLNCWHEELRPALEEAKIRLLHYDDLKRKQRKLLRKLFKKEIFPVLTPLAFDPGHPFPHISNLSINLAVVVQDPQGTERFARLKVPQSFPRLLRIPSEERAEGAEVLGLDGDRRPNFIWLEEVVAANLDLLFPGFEVVAAHPFRVTRDADFEVEEDEASDLLEAMSEVVGMRHFGSAIRLEVDQEMPALIHDILVRNLELAPYQVTRTRSPIGMADLMQLFSLDRPELKDPPFLPVVPQGLGAEDDLFATIRERDVLLYHPYDSFNPVTQFVRQAAEDPQVLAIKQTLYRVGGDSPIVEALQEARENGKQVSTLVELKARFDEENNIVWARALERAGVHVVYGVVGLKTHAKICLVVRREPGGIRRYVHLGTGNYNPATSRVYTDLGYFTADPEIAEDVSNLFNRLTGYSLHDQYNKLLVAPRQMRPALLERIEREIERHRQAGDGYLLFKMNSLVDKAFIQALYRASRAGVRVDLIVRGICCLRPGVPEVSENITVRSIVGRFLEHARAYYFHNGGEPELLLGSADMMPRNLNGRVETLFPVRDPKILAAIREPILGLQLRDTAQAHHLLPDGTYEPVQPSQEGEEALDSQAALLSGDGIWRFQES